MFQSVWRVQKFWKTKVTTYVSNDEIKQSYPENDLLYGVTGENPADKESDNQADGIWFKVLVQIILCPQGKRPCFILVLKPK